MVARPALRQTARAMSVSAYQLVRLANGAVCVRSLADAETFHPGIGPEAEADALYVRQLRLPERLVQTTGEFVLWDVGLGAAANALTALRRLAEALARRPPPATCALRLVSFDRTEAALRFARAHVAELGYLRGFEAAVDELLATNRVGFQHGGLDVDWTLVPGDFPAHLRAAPPDAWPAPHAMLFDPHSPRANPAMWTASLFSDLHKRLEPQRPCALATFSRSTAVRAALLLGGFFVGAGHATGFKEETTVAANTPALLTEPLRTRWLERARRSDSAEPLWEPVYRRERLREETWERLRQHPQFRNP